MLLSIVRFLGSLRRSRHDDQERQTRSNLIKELEGSCKFSLNALMAFLVILATSGSNALQPVALTLLIYTISLQLVINACFLNDYPTMSRFLHAIPILGTFCMACVTLVSGLQSPALAAIALVLGLLPLVAVVIHQGILCAETSTAALPVRVQIVSAATASGTADSSTVV